MKFQYKGRLENTQWLLVPVPVPFRSSQSEALTICSIPRIRGYVSTDNVCH